MRNLFRKLVNQNNKKIVSVLAGVVIISCLITTVCLGCGLNNKELIKSFKSDNSIVKSIEKRQDLQCNNESKNCNNSIKNNKSNDCNNSVKNNDSNDCNNSVKNNNSNGCNNSIKNNQSNDCNNSMNCQEVTSEDLYDFVEIGENLNQSCNVQNVQQSCDISRNESSDCENSDCENSECENPTDSKDPGDTSVTKDISNEKQIEGDIQKSENEDNKTIPQNPYNKDYKLNYNTQCDRKDAECDNANCLNTDENYEDSCNNKSSNCTKSNCLTENQKRMLEEYLGDLSKYSNLFSEYCNNGSCNIKVITGNNNCSLEDYLNNVINNDTNSNENTIADNNVNTNDNPNVNTNDNSNANTNNNPNVNTNDNPNVNTNGNPNEDNNSHTSNSQTTQYIDEVIRLVNVERNKAGLPSVTKNANACMAANVRANEIITSFSHTRPNGKDCFSVLSEYNINYRACGENIAMGQKTPEEVMEAWMNSSGHRANILSANFSQIGVGVVYSQGRYYWAQMFLG